MDIVLLGKGNKFTSWLNQHVHLKNDYVVGMIQIIYPTAAPTLFDEDYWFALFTPPSDPTKPVDDKVTTFSYNLIVANVGKSYVFSSSPRYTVTCKIPMREFDIWASNGVSGKNFWTMDEITNKFKDYITDHAKKETTPTVKSTLLAIKVDGLVVTNGDSVAVELKFNPNP